MAASITATLLADFQLAAGLLGATGGGGIGTPGEVRATLASGGTEPSQRAGAPTVSQPQQGTFEVKT